MTGLLKTFKTDRLVRDATGRPLGRLVLADPYVEGRNIRVAVLDVPRVAPELAKQQTFYIDGHPYKLPPNLPEIRFTPVDNRLKINNFYLMLEEANK